MSVLAAISLLVLILEKHLWCLDRLGDYRLEMCTVSIVAHNFKDGIARVATTYHFTEWIIYPPPGPIDLAESTSVQIHTAHFLGRKDAHTLADGFMPLLHSLHV